MTQPKHQHWVPQFYLRYFSTSDTVNSKNPKVWVWDKASRNSLPAPVSVRNVCGQRYLYTPEDKTGSRDWTLESHLSMLEGGASEIWPYLLNGKLDLGNSVFRGFLAKFIALLHLRNVAIFRTIDKIMELRDQLYGPPGEKFMASRKPSDPDPLHSGRYFVHMIQTGAGNIADQLVQKRWIVACSDEPVFITADRPVIFSPKPSKWRENALILPLSPTRVLCMDGKMNEAGNIYCKSSDAGPGIVNSILESKAVRLIISSEKYPK